MLAVGGRSHLARPESQEHIFQNAEWETKPLGNVATTGGADLQQVLANERLDDNRADARLIERLRLGRMKHLIRQQRRQQSRLSGCDMTGWHRHGNSVRTRAEAPNCGRPAQPMPQFVPYQRPSMET